MKNYSTILRPLAILLMLAGAGGFFATRVFFGDQTLCMLGSTLVVFLGLGLIIYQRRNLPSQPSTIRQNTNKYIQEQEPEHYTYENIPQSYPVENAFVNTVTDYFQQSGARVVVETRRDDRLILIITNPDGSQYTAIVNQSPEPVDIPELRALLALVSNNGSQLGYYITSGSFTPRASTWISGKPLRLIEEGDL